MRNYLLPLLLFLSLSRPVLAQDSPAGDMDKYLYQMWRLDSISTEGKAIKIKTHDALYNFYRTGKYDLYHSGDILNDTLDIISKDGQYVFNLYPYKEVALHSISSQFMILRSGNRKLYLRSVDVMLEVNKVLQGEFHELENLNDPRLRDYKSLDTANIDRAYYDFLFYQPGREATIKKNGRWSSGRFWATWPGGIKFNFDGNSKRFQIRYFSKGILVLREEGSKKDIVLAFRDPLLPGTEDDQMSLHATNLSPNNAKSSNGLPPKVSTDTLPSSIVGKWLAMYNKMDGSKLTAFSGKQEIVFKGDNTLEINRKGKTEKYKWEILDKEAQTLLIKRGQQEAIATYRFDYLDAPVSLFDGIMESRRGYVIPVVYLEVQWPGSQVMERIVYHFSGN